MFVVRSSLQAWILSFLCSALAVSDIFGTVRFFESCSLPFFCRLVSSVPGFCTAGDSFFPFLEPVIVTQFLASYLFDGPSNVLFLDFWVCPSLLIVSGPHHRVVIDQPFVVVSAACAYASDVLPACIQSNPLCHPLFKLLQVRWLFSLLVRYSPNVLVGVWRCRCTEDRGCAGSNRLFSKPFYLCLAV